MIDPTAIDPEDYLSEDDDLANLRALYRQKVSRLNQFNQDATIPKIAGGLLDAISAGQQGQARAAAIATGKPVEALGYPNASGMVDKALLATKDKALNDIQMFKTLEDLARRKQEKMLDLRRQDLDRATKQQYYSALLGDKQAQRDMIEAITGKKIQSAYDIAAANRDANTQRYDADRASRDKAIQDKFDMMQRQLEELSRHNKATEKNAEDANKIKAKKGSGPGKSALDKLSGEQKMKVGMMADALRSLNQYESAFNAGGRRSRINPDTPIIGSFLNASPIDEASTKLSDDIGRLRSGGAINQDEEARFLRMLPTAADDDATARRKLENIRTEFRNKISIFGVDENALAKGGFQLGSVQSAPTPKAPAPKVGEVRKGYKFMGGDPTRKESWQKVK